MFQALFSDFKALISSERIQYYTREISRLEGNESYCNYRASTDLFLQLMKESGFEEISRYSLPADGKTTYFDCTMPQAWETTGRSFLRLDLPGIPENERILADSDESQFVPGVWSGPTPDGGVDCRIIHWLEAEKNPECISGNMIYMPAFDTKAYKFIADHNGVGIVMTYPPITEEFPDDYRWNNGLSFCGWYHVAGEKRICAFSLTPRRAALLEKYLTPEGIPVHVEVRTKISDGEIYTLTGIIPGKTQEEITLLAHMYEPFLPDDTAGGVLICELCRCIKEQIKSGKLPPLEKTIRIVLGMERYGYSEYFQNQERNARTLTVISMDSPCHYPGSSTFPEIKFRLSSIIQPSFLDLLTPELCRKLLPARRLLLEKGNLSDDTFCSDDWIGIPSIWFHSADKKYHHCTCYKFMDANWDLADDIVQLTGTLIGRLATGNAEDFKAIAAICSKLAGIALEEKIAAILAEQAAGKLTAFDTAEKIRFHAEIMAKRLLSINRFAPGTVQSSDTVFLKEMAEKAADIPGVETPVLSGSRAEAKKITVKRLVPNCLMSMAKVPLEKRRDTVIPCLLYILLDETRPVYDAVKLYEYEMDSQYTQADFQALLEDLDYLETYGYVKLNKDR